MTDTTEAADLLRQAAGKFRAAAAARDQAADELADAIRVADAAGMARNEIVEVAGVARMTVYRAVEGFQSPRRRKDGTYYRQVVLGRQRLTVHGATAAEVNSKTRELISQHQEVKQ